MATDKLALFKQTELFGGVDDDAIRSLAARAVKRKLDRNEILFVAGEPAQGMYVLESGSVRAFRMNPDGREQVIHVERAVTTIAEVPVFDNGTYPSTVAAEEASVLYFLARDHVLKTATEHPQLALAAARLMAARLRRCAQLVESLSLREVGQRVASIILAQAKSGGTNSDDGVKLRLALTQNQLAARVGTVREVVARTLTRLGEDGLIIHKGKEILIPDIRALAAYADEKLS